MDLDEHGLSEGQRTLKRLGVTHLWPAETPARSGSMRTEPSCISAPPATHRSSSDHPALPESLRALFHGKQCPVRTLWAYDGLYADLRADRLSARLDVFRKIQESVRTHLGWSEQDISSWPLDLEPHLIRLGMDRLQPQVIICFGEAGCLRSIAGSEPTSPRITLLPDLQTMARGDRDLKNEAWRVLRSLSPSS